MESYETEMLINDTFIIISDLPIVEDDNLIPLLASIFDNICRIVVLISGNKKNFISLRQDINNRELRIISDCFNDEKYINQFNTLHLSSLKPIFK